MSTFNDPTTATIARFLNEIGIQTVPATIEGETFLPGIRVVGGTLHVDESKLKYPGDLLHEAGHIAVMPSEARALLNDDDVTLEDDHAPVIEVHAIAWSFAAARHLGIDPEVVFHPNGYHGQAPGLLLSYSMGVYPGIKGLLDAEMTAVGEDARARGVEPFPHMIKWMRD